MSKWLRERTLQFGLVGMALGNFTTSCCSHPFCINSFSRTPAPGRKTIR